MTHIMWTLWVVNTLLWVSSSSYRPWLIPIESSCTPLSLLLITLDQIVQLLWSLSTTTMIDNTIKFADFLDCAHAQTQVEKVPDEILRAFKVSPFVKNQNISVDVFRHLMCNWGEKLTHREFNALLKEMNINRPEFSYSQLVTSMKIPRLDSWDVNNGNVYDIMFVVLCWLNRQLSC